VATSAIGIFGTPHGALAAAARLKGAGFADAGVMSPIPLEGAEEMLGQKKSVIKRFTLFGAILGCATGFALAAGTAVLYLHPTGGRPIIPFPPFLVITYEMTILFGILATVIGFLISARLPAIRERAYAPEAAVDRFAVTVSCANAERCERAAAILREAGAEEVRNVEDGQYEADSGRWIAAIVAALLLGHATAGWGFPWDQDMVDQPSAKPQESPAPPPPNSVPISGRETLPAPTTESELFKAKDEAATLRNPVPATAESVARGAYLYEINCVVCHGKQGRGDGPVGRKFDPAPVDLNKEYTQGQADGQLFFTLTRGRVAMPFYRDALSQQERWDVINYLRSAFGSKQ
jgi:mono/diheme cytochrome c family protein/rhodanese-related sulfurtransferase